MALPPIIFDAKLFSSPGDHERSRRALAWLMFALSQINREFLLANPNFPRLYNTAVIWKAESGERWQDAQTTLQRGFGDCEDIACWRIGELQAREKIAALPYMTWRKVGNRTIMHAVVRHPNGWVEDPSRALGMHGHPAVRKPVFI